MPRTPTAPERWRGVTDAYRRSGIEQAESCRRSVSLHTLRKDLSGSRLVPEDVTPSAGAVGCDVRRLEAERLAHSEIARRLARISHRGDGGSLAGLSRHRSFPFSASDARELRREGAGPSFGLPSMTVAGASTTR